MDRPHLFRIQITLGYGKPHQRADDLVHGNLYLLQLGVEQRRPAGSLSHAKSRLLGSSIEVDVYCIQLLDMVNVSFTTDGVVILSDHDELILAGCKWDDELLCADNNISGLGRPLLSSSKVVASVFEVFSGSLEKLP